MGLGGITKLMRELSLLIPARNEMFLRETVEDAIKNIEADTDIIVVLDGAWADPQIPQHDKVSIIYTNSPIGQRASQNLACNLSRSKYVMKIDAHCSFDKGFDKKMLDFMEEHGDITAVPVMRNLWAFDWKCYHCGWKKYQGPTPKKCESCGKDDNIKRKMMWVGKTNPQSTTYRFDSEPHFQYFNDYKKRPEYDQGGYNETMSLQGSCFMISRDNYWKWDVCDEKAGSWGNQGIEVALATWFNGGKVLCNHKTWYAHMFRTQGGDFGFPYEQRGKKVQTTKQYIKDKYWSNPKLKDLLHKFWPVPGWTEEEVENL